MLLLLLWMYCRLLILYIVPYTLRVLFRFLVHLRATAYCVFLLLLFVGKSLSFINWRNHFFNLKRQALLAWENSRHFPTPSLVSPRNDVRGTSTEFPYWWRATNQVWVVFLINWKFALSNHKHYAVPGSDLSSVWNFCARFRPQKSCCGETRGSVAKWQLFSQASTSWLLWTLFLPQSLQTQQAIRSLLTRTWFGPSF